jgi:hypothetical protein
MKHCTFRRRALNDYLSAVVLNNLVYYCQPQASAILFALADERIKEGCPHACGDSVAIIGNINFDSVRNFAKQNAHPSGAMVYSFASIQ